MKNYFKLEYFFPSSTQSLDLYNVSIFQVNNKIIINEKNKRIIVIKKAGIGDKIYQFAQKQSRIIMVY